MPGGWLGTADELLPFMCEPRSVVGSDGIDGFCIHDPNNDPTNTLLCVSDSGRACLIEPLKRRKRNKGQFCWGLYLTFESEAAQGQILARTAKIAFYKKLKILVGESRIATDRTTSCPHTQTGLGARRWWQVQPKDGLRMTIADVDDSAEQAVLWK